MKQLRITVVRKADYADLQQLYENPIAHPCDLHVGQTFCSDNAAMPAGMCESAWQNIYPFALALASGASDLFDGWMKNPHAAMISCNDGFRPVSFYVETIEPSTELKKESAEKVNKYFCFDVSNKTQQIAETLKRVQGDGAFSTDLKNNSGRKDERQQD